MIRKFANAAVALVGLSIVTQHVIGDVPRLGSYAPPRMALRDGALLVPVAGVARTALRDSFDAPRSGHRHEAIDILAPRGTPALAAADGIVTKLRTGGSGGITITLASGPTSYYYAHLDHYAPLLYEGMPVRRGDVIGYVGTTGNAPANTPHLHFGMEQNGQAVDPYPLLAAAR
jgi:murein DD-endopeptidase MepM/ murein hydrolase activator NlpD